MLFRSFTTRGAAGVILAVVLTASVTTEGSESDGEAIYREHCQSCHGEGGAGSDASPNPLVGDRSVSQLTSYIADTMPEGEPEAIVGADARAVAAYIHATFYSPIAQDRLRPAREELSRLTVRQHRHVLADLLGSFERPTWNLTDERGLQASYYKGRNHDRRQLVFERVDPMVRDKVLLVWEPVGPTVAAAGGSVDLVYEPEDGSGWSLPLPEVDGQRRLPPLANGRYRLIHTPDGTAEAMVAPPPEGEAGKVVWTLLGDGSRVGRLVVQGPLPAGLVTSN